MHFMHRKKEPPAGLEPATPRLKVLCSSRERIEKVEHFYRKLRYSQMHSNPGATLKIPKLSYKAPP